MSEDRPESSNGSLSAENAAFAEQLLGEYLQEPSRVSPAWRKYFRDLLAAERPVPVAVRTTTLSPTPPVLAPSLPLRALPAPANRLPLEASLPRGDGDARSLQLDAARLQDRLRNLVQSFRGRGHLAARLDPLGLSRPEPDDLLPRTHGLADADLDRTVSVEWLDGTGTQTVRQVLERLQNTYCRYIGAQFLHIDDATVRTWLQQRMEALRKPHPTLAARAAANSDPPYRRSDLRAVRSQEIRGGQTFSLEGAESLIPLLDLAILKASRQGIVEIVLGMPPRPAQRAGEHHRQAAAGNLLGVRRGAGRVGPRKAPSRRRGHRPYRRALSARRRNAAERNRNLRRKNARRLGAGRAAKHGRVADARAAVRADAPGAKSVRVRGSSRVGQSRDRIARHPQARAANLVERAFQPDRDKTADGKTS